MNWPAYCRWCAGMYSAIDEGTPHCRCNSRFQGKALNAGDRKARLFDGFACILGTKAKSLAYFVIVLQLGCCKSQQPDHTIQQSGTVLWTLSE